MLRREKHIIVGVDRMDIEKKIYICQHEWKNSSSAPQNITFPEMGLTLWLFISRLFALLHRESGENVFFCSKEGEFLKQSLEVYQDKMFGSR